MAVHISTIPKAGTSSLVELLRQRAAGRFNGANYVFSNDGESEETSWSYADVDSKARCIAAALQSRGLEGRHAVLLYPPGLEFIAAFFGCLYAGVVAVPAYPPRLNRNALRIVSIAQDSQAS